MKQNIDAKMLKDMFISGAGNLQNHRDLVDKLNIFPVPDGDTGTNMSLTIGYAIKELEKTAADTVTGIGKAMSKGSLMGARGNSGVILSQIIRGFAKSIEGKETLDSVDLAKALKNGSDTAYKAVIKPIEGTILTVVRETGEYAVKHAKKEKDITAFMTNVVEAAQVSLEKTPTLLKALADANVVDSGGKGLVCFYEGMLEALKGNIISIKTEGEEVKTSAVSQGAQPVDADIKFGYCTEFILETKKENQADTIRDIMLNYGDSLAVVGDDGVVKVHVHTNEPGKVLSEALRFGQLVTTKIENMRLQHQNIVLEQGKEKEQLQNENSSKEETKPAKEHKKYAFIATSMGDGLASIFKDFGVDCCIEGGQTMNPSTEDFLKAIDEIDADHIIILPNNGNIIMAANQAKEISEKSVTVIPTKNIPHGFSALVGFDPEADIETNEASMNEMIELVKSGEITFAVRDTNMNGIDVKEGNIIGIAQKELKAAGDDVAEVTSKLIDSLADEDTSIITLYYGNDVTEEQAEELRESLEEKYEDTDVEIYYGGQPLYYYLVSVE